MKTNNEINSEMKEIIQKYADVIGAMNEITELFAEALTNPLIDLKDVGFFLEMLGNSSDMFQDLLEASSCKLGEQVVLEFIKEHRKEKLESSDDR